MNNPDSDSPPPPPPHRRWWERLPWVGRDGDGEEDPIKAAGRELLSSGRITGLVVGASLGFAAWRGHVEPVRTSLVLLATAAVVIMVLGSDAFREVSKSGFKTPARKAVGGTAAWTMGLGVVGVMSAAALLPWLGTDDLLQITRPGMALLVGGVGGLLGLTLVAPMEVAASDGESQREDRDSPPPEQGDETTP